MIENSFLYVYMILYCVYIVFRMIWFRIWLCWVLFCDFRSCWIWGKVKSASLGSNMGLLNFWLGGSWPPEFEDWFGKLKKRWPKTARHEDLHQKQFQKQDNYQDYENHVSSYHAAQKDYIIICLEDGNMLCNLKIINFKFKLWYIINMDL